MLPARAGTGTAPGASRRQTQPISESSWRERALSVQARRDPRAAVGLGGVGERNPAGQILLRLEVGVAVVLVPGELRRGPGFL